MISDRNPGEGAPPFQVERAVMGKIIHGPVSLFRCKIRAYAGNTSGGLCVNLQKIFIMIRIELDRINGDFGFEAKDATGHTARMDTSPDGGGEDFGIRPMQ